MDGGIVPCRDARCVPPALRAGSNRLYQVLDVCSSSPETSDVRYKSRQLEETICSGCEGSGCEEYFSYESVTCRG